MDSGQVCLRRGEERELRAGGLAPVEKGLTTSLPDFDCLMYAVLRR